MSNQEQIRSYIVKELQRGFTLPSIKKKLIQVGYKQKDVEDTIALYNLHLKEQDIHFSDERTIPTKKLQVFGLTILLLAAVWVSAWSILSEVDCGNDPVCFLDLAEQCEPAKFTQSLDGVIFSDKSTLVSQVGRDCSLKQTMLLAQEEPQQYQDLLHEKSLYCSQFSERRVQSIIGGLKDCEGELKDGLVDIARAAATLS